MPGRRVRLIHALLTLMVDIIITATILMLTIPITLMLIRIIIHGEFLWQP
jgi:hypothetical protein